MSGPGAEVDPNLSLADMLPPDRADASRILQAAFELVAAVARRTPEGRAEIIVVLDAAGWAALEAERRRYLRPHASYVYAPHPDGAGAVRLVRAPIDCQATEGVVPTGRPAPTGGPEAAMPGALPASGSPESGRAAERPALYPAPGLTRAVDP